MNSLNILYKELDFNGGALLKSTDEPSHCRHRNDWLEKGEWLAAAKRADAEKIFFVENNPVVVFSECGREPIDKIKAFNKAWCLARPRLLFLASPGEITVYDLAQKPADENNPKEWERLRTLKVLDDLKKVSCELQEFHRDNIESGQVFGDERFGDLGNRADKALIRDLKTIRRELINAGLTGKHVHLAHALIGRSIFIRYLEDRDILSEKYFRNVAGQKAGWTEMLTGSGNYVGADFSKTISLYSRVLNDKEFTFALFKALARDFNGDIFPCIEEEEESITPEHLSLIRDLLYGNVGIQKKLFFYSYRFDIIPLDLISSIYEEFYHSSTSDEEKKSKARQEGAYYTPSVLVEFVLSRVLTSDVIKQTPRVLDPACGSGIFLVEAFRRIVRYEWHRKKAPLTFDELKAILKNQIAGIEVNPEAARISAFSLCLSMLHYLDPPAIDHQIKQGNKLPCLLASNNRASNNYHCILAENAFDIETIESNVLWRDRFNKECADVIVGNPPWGKPGSKADSSSKARHRMMIDWCKSHGRSIGDEEPSQAFLWRASDFMKNNGKAGMLVSAGVLFKHGSTTQAFRTEWMTKNRFDEVYNFAHVRKFFFKGAISPFLAICFSKGRKKNNSVRYGSAKQTHNLHKNQVVMFSRHDLHWLLREDLANNVVWKTYWLGHYADSKFVKQLSQHKHLGSFVDRAKSGAGFKVGTRDQTFYDIKCISHKTVSRYDSFELEDPPSKTERPRAIQMYTFPRLIVKRGINEQALDKGRIVARYTEKDFTFSEWLYGVQFTSPEQWLYKAMLGIIWSSISRYYLFMTSSQWGLWYSNIHFVDELLQLPVVLDKDNISTTKVISVVDKLRAYHPEKQDVLPQKGVSESTIEAKRRKWEAQLDDAVFDLYGLSEEQKDLIRDCCDVTLPFFYKPFDSVGAMKAVDDSDYSGIENYVKIFCRRWNGYLDKNGEMRAEVHVGAHGNMVAIEFYSADKKDSWDLEPKDDSWGYVLEQIGNSLPQPMGTSQILLDGLVHVVSDDGVIIIKRNEKRFWTRSLAREDAEATLCKRMADTMQPEGRKG